MIRLALVLTCTLAIGVACDDTDVRDRLRSASGPKARLERINSVAPKTLEAEGTGVERTSSGIATKQIYRGNGKRHATNQDAVVLYSQVYDSRGRVTVRGRELIGDPAADLTKHGQEAIQLMVEGEVRRFWFPDPKKPGRVKVTDFEVVWISSEHDEP